MPFAPLFFGLLGSSLLSGGLGMAGSALSNYYAGQQASQARKENFELNEQAAKNADVRTRKLYGDLYSPQAQIQQLKDAGLSPSVFYANGGGGISGQAGAQGGGASGIQTQTFGVPKLSPTDVAEVNMMNAQARKLNAEADTEEGTNERGSAEIQSIVENTKNTTLKNVYQEFENALSEINLTVEASLQEEKIKNYVEQTRYLTHITRSAAVKGDIDEASKNDVINYLHEKTLNLAADTLLKGAQQKLAESGVQLQQKQMQDLISQIATRENLASLSHEELAEQVKQWAKENGFTEQHISNETTNLIWDNWNKTGRTIVELLKALKR